MAALSKENMKMPNVRSKRRRETSSKRENMMYEGKDASDPCRWEE